MSSVSPRPEEPAKRASRRTARGEIAPAILRDGRARARPPQDEVRERHRLTVAAALTGQLVGDMALTGIAMYLVAIYLIPLGLPAFGAVVRDFAADLATYNAPARMMIWLTGGM
jgi:hypothetical protein